MYIYICIYIHYVTMCMYMCIYIYIPATQRGIVDWTLVIQYTNKSQTNKSQRYIACMALSKNPIEKYCIFLSLM